MRAVQEFLAEKEIANVSEWVITGASKRGWVSWLVAAVQCETCAAKVIGIAPVEPIVPSLSQDIHQQW